MANSLDIGVPWIMCQQPDAPQPMVIFFKKLILLLEFCKIIILIKNWCFNFCFMVDKYL